MKRFYTIAALPPLYVLFGLCLAVADTPKDAPFDRVLNAIKSDYTKNVKTASDLYDKRYQLQVEPIIKRIKLGRDKAIAEATRSAKARLKAAAANCLRLGDEVSAALYEKEADQLKMPVIEKTEVKPEARPKSNILGKWNIKSDAGYRSQWTFREFGIVTSSDGFKGKWQITNNKVSIKWPRGVDILRANILVGESHKGVRMFAIR